MDMVLVNGIYVPIDDIDKKDILETYRIIRKKLERETLNVLMRKKLQ